MSRNKNDLGNRSTNKQNRIYFRYNKNLINEQTRCHYLRMPNTVGKVKGLKRDMPYEGHYIRRDTNYINYNVDLIEFKVKKNEGSVIS